MNIFAEPNHDLEIVRSALKQKLLEFDFSEKTIDLILSFFYTCTECDNRKKKNDNGFLVTGVRLSLNHITDHIQKRAYLNS